MDDTHLTVEWQEGIFISTKEERICFDPQRRKREFDRIFISHSHSDHTAAFSYDAVKYSTFETRQVFEARYRRSVNNFKTIEYDRTVKIGSLEVIPRNAGHILGSTQFEVHTPEESIVYTGDINCVDTLITKAATPIECDILIIETTYGNPTFVFPRREEVYVDIAKWAVDRVREGKTPVFEVYSVGKAQEIVALINYFTELPVVVNRTIGRVNEVHRKFGIDLDFVDVNSREGQEILRGRDCCYIIPPRHGQQDLPENAARAIATGWGVRFRPRKYDKVFPLSNHADLGQLLSYIKEVKPSIVYTCLGQSKVFSRYITKKTGIRSLPLVSGRPLFLSERKESKIESSIDRVLDLVVVPGFVYKEKWILRKLISSGFSEYEAEEVLDYMEKVGMISYEKDFKGYRLT